MEYGREMLISLPSKKNLPENFSDSYNNDPKEISKKFDLLLPNYVKNPFWNWK